MNRIVDVLKNKRICIFGYGREGKSSEKFIREHVDFASLDVYEGSVDGLCTEDYDIILKSPGIMMNERTEKFTSQTELFLNEFHEQVIGITGTKGKSTTSYLFYEALKACGKKTVIVGNMGKPCFDLIDEIDKNTVVVFELSCHQLLFIDKAPHISVFLNLYPEHLDYYKTAERYFEAKSHIVTHQEKGDIAFLGTNVPINRLNVKPDVYVVDKVDEEITLTIPGDHNRLNATFIVKALQKVFPDLSKEDIIKGMAGFRGLPHRIEYLGRTKYMDAYDDSISTIPEAVIQGYSAIFAKHGKVDFVLVGGMDREIDYSKLESFIEEHRKTTFVLMYATGRRIFDELKRRDNVVLRDDLKDSVDYVKMVARKHRPETSVVVLSPAAASYGYFTNFEERGDVFKALIFE